MGNWRASVFPRRGQPLGADVDWASYPWPEPSGHSERRILRALRAVVEPRRRDWSDPITMVQYAVGNGHAGTVYPAALAMVGQLLLVAENYPGEPRWRALTMLTVWWGGYHAEPGLQSYLDGSGVRVALLPAMAERIADGTDLYTRIAAGDPDPDCAAAARELLTVIPLGWGHSVEDDGTVSHWGGRVKDDGSVHFPSPGANRNEERSD